MCGSRAILAVKETPTDTLQPQGVLGAARDHFRNENRNGALKLMLDDARAVPLPKGRSPNFMHVQGATDETGH